MQHVFGDDESAENTHKIRDDRQQGQNHRGREHARGHQLLNGIRSQGPHRIDLLCHLHRSQFTRDTGGVAAGHHQRSQHGSQFADQSDRYNLSCFSDLAVLL